MLELEPIAVIGPGRLGTALSAALRAAGARVEGPLGREERPTAPVVLLCVPDSAIADAARAVPRGPKVGHCSGATTLAPITAARHPSFSLHPLMTVPTRPHPPADFRGVPAAVAGDPVGTDIAEALGMRPFHIADDDRAAYHAAACMASNFLVALESAAERVAATAQVERDTLLPLIRATVDNWARDGHAALTGPVARGDVETVERHRDALRERTPDLVPLYDALAAAC